MPRQCRNLLVLITAALFAAWYTYGFKFGWLFDTYHLKDGTDAANCLAVMTVLVSDFICVVGTYTFVKEAVES